jgi:hypothetical protein
MVPAGHPVAQAVSRWLPTAAARVRVRTGMWGLWTKRHWGRFSPSTSVSLANHSTSFSIITITQGWHNRPIGGLSAEWTQLDSTPTTPILWPRNGPHRKHPFHCCVFSHCRRNNVSTELFPSNGFCTVACLHSCYLAIGLHVNEVKDVWQWD